MILIDSFYEPNCFKAYSTQQIVTAIMMIMFLFILILLQISLCLISITTRLNLINCYSRHLFI